MKYETGINEIAEFWPQNEIRNSNKSIKFIAIFTPRHITTHNNTGTHHATLQHTSFAIRNRARLVPVGNLAAEDGQISLDGHGHQTLLHCCSRKDKITFRIQ
jgi:hypothetical protein